MVIFLGDSLTILFKTSPQSPLLLSSLFKISLILHKYKHYWFVKRVIHFLSVFSGIKIHWEVEAIFHSLMSTREREECLWRIGTQQIFVEWMNALRRCWLSRICSIYSKLAVEILCLIAISSLSSKYNFLLFIL